MLVVRREGERDTVIEYNSVYLFPVIVFISVLTSMRSP